MNRFEPNEIISLTGELPPYNLAESYGPHLTIADILGTDEFDRLLELPLGYQPAEGDRRLREMIAARTGFGADEVIVTMGAVHALFLVAFAACAQGDEAVIASPIFPPTRAMLRAIGAELREVPALFDRGYRIEADDILEVLTPKTRLVSLASPQNPSGVAIAPEAIERIRAGMGAICPAALLLIDETYREAVFDDQVPRPSTSSLHPMIITCSSLSKAHGAPGLRIGWVIARDPKLREQLLLGGFNSIISCPAADQFLAAKLLEADDKLWAPRGRQLGQCLGIFSRWMASQAAFVEWVPPDAGALCCVRLRRDAFDDDAVGRFYATLGDVGVAVSPGHWFGEEDRIFRLGFGFLPPEELAEGLRRMSDVLRRTSASPADAPEPAFGRP